MQGVTLTHKMYIIDLVLSKKIFKKFINIILHFNFVLIKLFNL